MEESTNFDKILTAINGLTNEQRKQLKDELNERTDFDTKNYLAGLQAQQADEQQAADELRQRFV